MRSVTGTGYEKNRFRTTKDPPAAYRRDGTFPYEVPETLLSYRFVVRKGMEEGQQEVRRAVDRQALSVKDGGSENAGRRDMEDGIDRPWKETGVVLQDRVDGNQETEAMGSEMARDSVRYTGETKGIAGCPAGMDQADRFFGAAEKCFRVSV